MKKILLILGVFIIFAVGITLIGCESYAQEPEDEEGVLFGLDLRKVVLTKEQTDELQIIDSSFKAERHDPQNILDRMSSEMLSLWQVYPPDAEKIIAKYREISSIRLQLQERGITYRIKAIRVLTKAQYAKTISNMLERPPFRSR